VDSPPAPASEPEPARGPEPERAELGEPARPRQRRTAFFVLVFLASWVVGTLGHFTAQRAAFRGRVLPGVSVLGASLGGMDEARAREAVRALEPRVARLVGHVQVRGRTFDVPAGAVHLALDVDGTARRALAFGRRGGAFADLGAFLAQAFSRKEVPIAAQLDPDAVESLLQSIERAALGEPGVEGSVAYAERVVPTYPREGFAIVRGEAPALLERVLVEPRPPLVALPVEARKPRLSRADVDRAVAEAERLVRSPVTLGAAEGDARLEMLPADLGQALRSRVEGGAAPRLDVSLDRDALRPVLDRARPSLERPARDATFSIGPRGEVTVVASELGTRLDDEAVLDAIVQAANGGERSGVLTFRKDVVPALTTEQAEGLHIRGLVSRYTTPFPCCEARVKNIERMAALVDGSVVRPGEVYSVNARSGPRTAQNGFVAGPTIVEGEMDLTIGGGVSQFATTLFNAAFDGGYEIIQRQAHTYWFPRYPEGHDATLGFPLPDLIFRNDSDAGVLIKATVGKTFVRVELYGDNGGRRVTRHVSPRFDVVRPETAVEANPSLQPDETKVLFGGSIGWSLNVSRVITYADGHQKEEHRKVTYAPRTRRIEVHPCKIPEGDPGYTGEKCPKVETPDGGS
jgi:vancomycin resistance protein YoaR